MKPKVGKHGPGYGLYISPSEGDLTGTSHWFPVGTGKHHGASLGSMAMDAEVGRGLCGARIPFSTSYAGNGSNPQSMPTLDLGGSAFALARAGDGSTGET